MSMVRCSPKKIGLHLCYQYSLPSVIFVPLIGNHISISSGLAGFGPINLIKRKLIKKDGYLFNNKTNDISICFEHKELSRGWVLCLKKCWN